MCTSVTGNSAMNILLMVLENFIFNMFVIHEVKRNVNIVVISNLYTCFQVLKVLCVKIKDCKQICQEIFFK